MLNYSFCDRSLWENFCFYLRCNLLTPLLQARGAGPSVLPGKPAIERRQRAADGAEAESGASYVRAGRSVRHTQPDSQRRRRWWDSQSVQHWALCCPMRRDERGDGASQEKTLNTQLSLYCLIWDLVLYMNFSVKSHLKLNHFNVWFKMDLVDPIKHYCTVI